jgi:elongation factor G
LHPGLTLCRNQIVETDEIPDNVRALAEEKRAELIEHLSEADETLCDLFLDEQPISNLDIAQALRRATISLSFTPVFVGSAIKNTGIQPLLDGVAAYLPSPDEVHNQALDAALPSHAPPVPLVPAQDAPLVGLAFKLEEGRYGQLTYMRVYQGELKRGSLIYNARTGKKVKVPRLVRMHSDEMEVSQLWGVT